jgi:hypothetical protein
MRQLVTTCDVCGVAKQEVNHWWTVRVGFQVNASGTPPTLSIEEFRPGLEPDIDAREVCGQAHAVVLVQRWMATGSLDAPPAESSTRTGACAGDCGEKPNITA